MDRVKKYIRRKSIERKDRPLSQVRQVHLHRGKKRDIGNVLMKKHQNHVARHQHHQCHQNISHKVSYL